MPLVGAIDQGTSSSRFLVFDTDNAVVVAQHQIEVKQLCPKSGWVELVPSELLRTVVQCMDNVAQQLKDKGRSVDEVKGIGITNHRESTIVWNSRTGEALYNCIVWLDARTATMAEEFVGRTGSKEKLHFGKTTGLPIHPYFSALKIRWILDNVPAAKDAVDKGEAMCGTVDSWLLWNLSNRQVHATDVTNASRYNLMDLTTLKWSEEVCAFYGIPMKILPTIRSSAEVYADAQMGAFKGVPICAILGDQQASLLGQQCISKGSAKCTYGTGVFLLYNTGETPVFSTNGMLTTVAYRLGPSSPPIYALEGSGSIGGTAVRWLRDNLGLISSAREVETKALTVADTNGCVFVPCFTGMFAPYWDASARATICGINGGTTAAHICRAALQAVVCQTKDIVDGINQECPALTCRQLRVDGGMTANKLLCRMQADLLQTNVLRAQLAEATAAGAAFAAAIALGIHTLSSFAALKLGYDIFPPSSTQEEADKLMKEWKKAVDRALKWQE